MFVTTVHIMIDNELEDAEFLVKRHPSHIHVKLTDGWKNTFEGADLYDCLGQILLARPDINFLCKGARRDVRPSSMSSQMSSGLVAYQHRLGVRASRNDIVRIFDYDDTDIVNDPKVQEDFFYRWLSSLKST